MSSLHELQEQMKQKVQSQQKTIQIPVKKETGDVVLEERVLCSTPGCVRVRRKGRQYCSRCTYKGIESQLRDTLTPPTPLTPPTMPDTRVLKLDAEQESLKQKRASSYIYAGVQEGQRSATSYEEGIANRKCPKCGCKDVDQEGDVPAGQWKTVCANCRLNITKWSTYIADDDSILAIETEKNYSAQVNDEDILGLHGTDEELQMQCGTDCADKAGSTVCKHMNEPLFCKDCRKENELSAVPGTQRYYSRKQVAEMIGASTSSISRWEAKGVTPLPKKLVHSGQYVYTEDHIVKMRAYMTAQETVTPIQRISRSRIKKEGIQEQEPEEQNPNTFNLSVSKIKNLGKGNSTNKKLNRVVAARLGSLTGR